MPQIYRLSQIIEELKRIQVEEGDVPVVTCDPELSQRPTWPKISKDKKNNTVILFS